MKLIILLVFLTCCNKKKPDISSSELFDMAEAYCYCHEGLQSIKRISDETSTYYSVRCYDQNYVSDIIVKMVDGWSEECE